MIIATLLNKEIKIYGDGYQVRDALFADDLVDAYIGRLKVKEQMVKFIVIGGYKSKISVISN